MSSTGIANLNIRPDYENNAEEWWNAARVAARTDNSQGAEVFRRLDAGRDDGAAVLPDELVEFIAWAEVLPGHDDGPAYARLPYVVVQE